ncbi:putative tetraspanin-19 [Gopherus evgoodei]|uniref:putative tetraspanin-19 n=1 Tax=Gopherus evgoodei TaxID=1825980 RepID=UPI0011CF8D6C|nr:putative tetraspanin-19 [Gopherus evgoodei]
MEPRDKILILKYFLSIFNGIFLVLALMLMMFSVWLLIDRNNLFTVLSFTGENHLIACISYMLLGTESIVVFISFLGFLGIFEEIRWLLILYLGLIVLLFGVQVAMPVLIYTRKEEVQIMWNDRIDAVISNYGNKNLTGREHEWDILNAVQNTGCDEYIKMRFENNSLVLIAINIALLTVEVLLFTLGVLLFKNIKKNKISLKE